jgi:type I restriction enzyme R subunit
MGQVNVMTQNLNETDSRIYIDDFLRQVGWDPKDKSEVGTEVYVPAGSVQTPLEAYGSGPASAAGIPLGSGRADYVLYGQNGRPLAVIEAKRNAINPYVAKQQALSGHEGFFSPETALHARLCRVVH